MAKKVGLVANISTSEDLRIALARVDEIAEQVEPLMNEAVVLKKAATQYAVKKKIDVVQLEEAYYRLISRKSRYWDEDIVQELTKAIEIKGKSLWLRITTRKLDRDKLQTAVAKGWISEKKLRRAYLEESQAPFLQRYKGEAD